MPDMGEVVDARREGNVGKGARLNARRGAKVEAKAVRVATLRKLILILLEVINWINSLEGTDIEKLQ